VDTVYLGGGTPSLLPPAALGRILDSVRDSFRCAFEEVTLEADPETVTEEKAAAWQAAGLNRISLGAQSFNDAELKAAGRMHRRGDIFEAASRLRRAGFANISFDLIAGLAHQTAESWRESLEGLLSLRPEHASIYMLEIDEGSRLGREALAGGTRYSADRLPNEDWVACFYELAGERLAGAGYEHYEISNWALPGFRSRHNLKYWRREPYLGFGAGAHSFRDGRRWANAHEPGAYVAGIEQGRLPVAQHEQLTPERELEEELFLGLRQLDGIDFARLEERYNVALRPRLKRLREAGLVEVDGGRVRLAPACLSVSNEVFVELLD
jgi:oxygen-independent coproporphyrinogen-3 oxidase